MSGTRNKRETAVEQTSGTEGGAAPFEPGGLDLRIDKALSLARCRVELDQCRSDLELCREELGRRTYELAQLGRICRRYENEVKALQASTSWRLTRPLRWVALRLRRR